MKTLRHSSFKAIGLTALLLLCALYASAQWTTGTISVARLNAATTSVGNKVLIAGGWTGSARTAVVDIYDEAANSWSTSALSLARDQFAAATVGTKAFFAGGTPPSGITSVVDIYDNSNSTWSTASLSQARYQLVASSAGSKILFAGGINGSASSVVDIYDNSSAAWTTSALSVARYQVAAAAVGNKIFFGGGRNGSGAASNVVDIYDVSTSTWTSATLSQARYYVAAATVGNKVFFAGGHTGSGYSNVVDIYDNSTNTWSTATLSQARMLCAVAAAGSKLLVAGGHTGSYSNVVDIYDNNTNTWSTSTLSEARYFFMNSGVASVNGKALFAGGEGGAGVSNVVDIYNSACIIPATPAVIATPDAVCSGGSSTLAISGSLGSAANWAVYSGGCGTGTAIATTTGTSVTLSNLTGTATYYVRGEGGCVSTPGSCGSTTVTVNSLPTISATSATPATICAGNSSNLNATSTGNNISWYTASTGGTSIGSSASGANFSVSPSGTTTYYAEAVTPDKNILGNGGHSGSGFGSQPYTMGYQFTPTNNITVIGVRSYFGSKVSVWSVNNTSTPVISQAVSATAGNWTVTPLSVPVTLMGGTTYRIGAYTTGNFHDASPLPTTFPGGTITGSVYTGGMAIPALMTIHQHASLWWICSSAAADVSPQAVHLLR